jgi:hypothetical protein
MTKTVVPSACRGCAHLHRLGSDLMPSRCRATRAGFFAGDPQRAQRARSVGFSRFSLLGQIIHGSECINCPAFGHFE